MPKIVSEEERQRTKSAMHEKVIMLLKKKGLTKVTVADICNAVNIGKGSFYSYYISKEELFYEVIKNSEQDLLAKITAAEDDGSDRKEKIRRLFREIYLAPDSIVLYLNPADMNWLIRKLPEEYYEREKEKSVSYFGLLMSALKIDPGEIDINVLSGLMDAIGYVAADNEKYGEEAKQTMLDVLVMSVADYLSR